MSHPPLTPDTPPLTTSSPRVTPVARRGRPAPPGWVVFGCAFLVMAPWPLLTGMALEYWAVFDAPKEVAFLFGGMTMIAALPCFALAGGGETAVLIIAYTVWALALLLVPALFVRRRRTRSGFVMLLVALGLFSAGQAALGALMIIGRDI